MLKSCILQGQIIKATSRNGCWFKRIVFFYTKHQASFRLHLQRWDLPISENVRSRNLLLQEQPSDTLTYVKLSEELSSMAGNSKGLWLISCWRCYFSYLLSPISMQLRGKGRNWAIIDCKTLRKWKFIKALHKLCLWWLLLLAHTFIDQPPFF